MKRAESRNVKPTEPPTGLSEESQKLWRKLVKGSISAARGTLLTQALFCLDRLRQVQSELQTTTLTTVTKRTGAIHLNPLVKLETELRRQFTSIWSTLSLQWRANIDGDWTNPGDGEFGDEK